MTLERKKKDSDVIISQISNIIFLSIAGFVLDKMGFHHRYRLQGEDDIVYATITMGIVLLIVILNDKVFNSISACDDFIELNYYSWFIKHEKKLMRADILLKLQCEKGKSDCIVITNKTTGETLYEIDGRNEGWGKDDLQELVDYVQNNNG